MGLGRLLLLGRLRRAFSRILQKDSDVPQIFTDRSPAYSAPKARGQRNLPRSFCAFCCTSSSVRSTLGCLWLEHLDPEVLDLALASASQLHISCDTFVKVYIALHDTHRQTSKNRDWLWQYTSRRIEPELREYLQTRRVQMCLFCLRRRAANKRSVECLDSGAADLFQGLDIFLAPPATALQQRWHYAAQTRFAHVPLFGSWVMHELSGIRLEGSNITMLLQKSHKETLLLEASNISCLVSHHAMLETGAVLFGVASHTWTRTPGQ